MQIREARPQDASDLGRVHVRAWQEAYKGGLMPDEYLRGLSEQERADMWRRALARSPRNRSARLVSVEAGQGVRGFILVGPAENDVEASEGQVYALNVDPAVWGRGHGRSLLEGGVDSLAGFAFESAVLWVHPANRRARRFYEAAGWSSDGEKRTADVLGVEVPEVLYRLTGL